MTIFNFAIAIYFGGKTEYMCFMNTTSPLLDNAIHYVCETEALVALEDAIEYGNAAGWQVEYGIYKFEL